MNAGLHSGVEKGMNKQIESLHPIPSAPIHPLAAMVTVVLDNVFMIFEIATPIFIILTSLTVFLLGSVTTAFIQHYLDQDSWGVSVAKGLAMGIMAGVPFSVTGTVIGVPLLAWAGLHEWVKLSPPKKEPQATDPNVVEGEYHEN
jgi:hypothetical protein